MTAPTPDDEKRYTLAEARAEFNRRECATHGHSWNVVQSIAGGPMRIVCESCGWSGSVEMTAPTPDTTAGERACDCDYWHSAHRWHCSINYAAALAPDTAGASA